MASLLDDLRYGFLRRHGFLGWMIVLNVGIWLLIAIPSVFLYIGNFGTLYQLGIFWLGVPSSLPELLARPWSVATYAFMHSHAGILHLGFNMLWLFWIGRILREYQPERRLVWLYAGGALSGAFFFLLMYNILPVFEGKQGILFGASAAVSGVIVGTATLLPNFQIGLFLFGLVRLKWLALAFVLLDFLFIPQGNAGGSIAHLGGALFGFVYMRSVQGGIELRNPFARGYERSRRHVHVASRNPFGGSSSAARGPVRAKPGTPTEDEVNRILDKIKAVGYDKLTKEEKQTLFNASND